MFRREIQTKIIEWFHKGKQPLLIKGARQIGKTFIIENTLKGLETKVHRFNFEAQSETLNEIFSHDLDPKKILANLALSTNQKIDSEEDVIFFDEIQTCERAITSLKYFNEQMPELKIIATGSYMGLFMGSFPVGKVNIIHMYPMTFEEFLLALLGEGPIMEAFQSRTNNQSTFQKIWPYLLQYFYVGGLPRAVEIWQENHLKNPVEAAEEVRAYHRVMIESYRSDFGKYSGKNALSIATIFDNIPMQLKESIDDSVNRYKFKDVLPSKKSFPQMVEPFSWLSEMRMIHKSFITSEVIAPVQVKDSIFKVFMFDMGILATQLNLTLKNFMDYNFEYKGYIAENFVAIEFKASGINDLRSWVSGNTAEIEFILESNEGAAIPIEVKSGTNKKAKSFNLYRDKYKPKKSIKLVGSTGGQHADVITLPLYYAGKVKRIVRE